MVSFDFASFNWAAIIAAGVAAWITGGVWFSPPVFGRRWVQALRVPTERAGNPAAGFVVAVVITIIGATFLRLLLAWAGASSILEGVGIALLIWFAFILLPSIPGAIFAKESSVAFALTHGQHAVAMAIMGIVLTAWT